MPPGAIAAALELGAAGARVADVGAGSGYCAAALFASPTPPSVVHAIDVSPEMLAALARRFEGTAHAGKVHTHVAPAETLPLGDASVDRVVMGNVFHEFDDRGRALAEAKRVLAPGGRLLVLDWELPAVVTGEPAVGPRWAHRVPEGEVAKALADAGFVDVRRHPGFRDVYALSGARPA